MSDAIELPNATKFSMEGKLLLLLTIRRTKSEEGEPALRLQWQSINPSDDDGVSASELESMAAALRTLAANLEHKLALVTNRPATIPVDVASIYQ